VRLLLDRHLFLWGVTDSPRLSAEARSSILAADEVCVSAVSIWEVATKAGLGRIKGDVRRLAEAIGGSGFVELPVTALHAATVAELPPHHRDPFDRLLVAQAMTEPVILLTADAALLEYSDLGRLAKPLPARGWAPATGAED
jgi:PIN domain nuclease of toxin-antitoxin system